MPSESWASKWFGSAVRMALSFSMARSYSAALKSNMASSYWSWRLIACGEVRLVCFKFRVWNFFATEAQRERGHKESRKRGNSLTKMSTHKCYVVCEQGGECVKTGEPLTDSQVTRRRGRYSLRSPRCARNGSI